MQKAIDVLSKGKNPFSKNLDKIYFNMAKCQLKLKKEKEAIDSLLLSIKHDKNNEEALYTLSKFLSGPSFTNGPTTNEVSFI